MRIFRDDKIVSGLGLSVRRGFPFLKLWLAAFAIFFAPLSGWAATYTVTTTADNTTSAASGTGSLRACVIQANANPGSTIVFAAAIDGQPITLTIAGDDDTAQKGDLDVTAGVNIVGNGPGNTIIQAAAAAGSGIDKIFSFNPKTGVAAGFAVTLSGVTLRYGKNVSASGTNARGGAFDFNGGTGGSLTVSNCQVINNFAPNGEGGGIALAGGSTSILNTLIAGNTASKDGGGIWSLGAPGFLGIGNSTISGNSAYVNGGGIYFGKAAIGTSGTTILTNVTIAANLADGDGNAAGIGGGIYGNQDGTANDPVVTLNNTVVSYNHRSSGSTADDVVGRITLTNSLLQTTSGATILLNTSSLVSRDPLLDVLSNNGGATQTQAILAGSPLIDAGSNALATAAGVTGNDQRGTGYPRLADGPDADTTQTIDIGAFEAYPSVQIFADQGTCASTSGTTIVSGSVSYVIPAHTASPLVLSVGVADATRGVTPTAVTTTSTDGRTLVTTSLSGSGATRTLTLTPVVDLSGTTTVTLTVTGTGTPAATMETSFLLRVYPPTAITVPPISKDICQGDPAMLSVTAKGKNLTYQWYKHAIALTNAGNVSGATSPTLTINPAVPLDSGTDYYVQVTGDCWGSDTSPNVTLTVYPTTQILTQPANVSECLGNPAILSVSATGSHLSYQWYKGLTLLEYGTTYSGVVSDKLTINSMAAENAGDYNVVVKGDCGTVTSSTATLSLRTATSITTQPVNQTGCLGGMATFTVSAAGSDLNYRWRKGTTPLDNGGNIAGASSSSLVISSLSAADVYGRYNVVVTGSCGTVVSDNVALAVTGSTSINSQPISATVCEGDLASLSVDASGGGDLTYQWYKGAAPLTNSGSVQGATSTTLTISPAALADSGSNYKVVITGTCGVLTSNLVSLVVVPATGIVTNPADQSACVGASAAMTVAATGTNLSYQWYRGVTPVLNGTRISGATSPNLTINPVADSDAATNYNVVVTGSCGQATSGNAALTVLPVTASGAKPFNQSVCTGSSATFVVLATGTNLTYQWRKGATALTNGGRISGATSSSLVIGNVTAADAGTDYGVVITGRCGNVTWTGVELAVLPTTAILTQPNGAAACANGLVSLAVSATGSNLTYQWYKGGSPLSNNARVSGATSPVLAISPAAVVDSGTDYQVVVRGDCGTQTSNKTTVTIQPTTAIIAQPAVQTNACAGDPAVLAISATGANLTYQWYKGGTLLNNGSSISGATSPSLIILSATPADSGTNYRVVVTGSCGTATSNNAMLSVNPAMAVLSHPVGQTICAGESASLAVSATGVNLAYQWYNGDLPLINGGNIAGATSPVLTINPGAVLDSGTAYHVVVSSDCGSKASNNAVLTVYPTTAILSDPQNSSVCAGSLASFSVAAEGGNLSYQWRKGTANLANGPNVQGATSSTLTLLSASAADAGADYNVVVTGACGSATSGNAALTVKTLTAITSQPASQTVCTGTLAAFSVNAEGASLTYQWRKGTIPLENGGRISGATSSTLTIGGVTAADAASNYNVVVTGLCNTRTSNNVGLTVTPQTVIVTQPESQTVCSGSLAGFAVNASGGNLRYQWRRGTVELSNVGNITGATSPMLVMNPVTESDAADYNVLVIGDCGLLTSGTVALTVKPATVVASKPSSQTVCSGSMAAFSIGVSGRNVSYQWRKGAVNLTNGGNISGATSDTLVISPASGTDAAANYNVVVTSDCGVFQSDPLTLNVTPVTAIQSQPRGQTLCTGSTAMLTVEAVGGNVTYQWRKGTTNLVNSEAIRGATSSTLIIAPATVADSGDDYNVVVSGDCGAVISDNASLAVQATTAIAASPLNQTVCTGSMATFVVQTRGSNLTYQWRRGVTNLVNRGNISGATSPVLTVTPATELDAASDYNVVVVGACGALVSGSAQLTVLAATEITSQPEPQSVCAGAPVGFSVKAVGSGVTYQWRKGTVNLVNDSRIGGATSSTLTLATTSAGDAGNYNVVVTGPCGVQTSRDVALVVNAKPLAPSIVLNPVSLIASTPANQASGPAGAVSYVWSVTNGVITSASNAQTVVFTTGSAGTAILQLTVTNAAGCEAITKKSVTVSSFFEAAAGSYDGLLENALPANANQGYLRVAVSKAGALSGTLAVGGLNYPLAGNFSRSGQLTLPLARSGQHALSLALQLEPGKSRVTGSVSDGSFTSSIKAGRLAAAGVSAGAYTVLLPPNSSRVPTQYPQGYGYAVMTVRTTGVVELSGKLGDGTPFVSSGYLKADGTFPIYAGLYGSAYPSRGSISGIATLKSDPGISDLKGSIRWFKPAQPTGTLFRSGFTTAASLIGSRYKAPATGIPVIRFSPVASKGKVVLTGGRLSAALTKNVTLGSTNVITVDAPAADQLRVSVVAGNGLVAGSFVHPVTGKTTAFGGVVFQIQNIAAGYFVITDQSGSLKLQSR